MRLLILAAALVPTAAFADIIQPPPRTCAVDSRVLAAVRAGEPGFRRLDRLPPAREYLTVFRAVARCPEPVVVRDDVTPRR